MIACRRIVLVEVRPTSPKRPWPGGDPIDLPLENIRM